MKEGEKLVLLFFLIFFLSLIKFIKTIKQTLVNIFFYKLIYFYIITICKYIYFLIRLYTKHFHKRNFFFKLPLN